MIFILKGHIFHLYMTQGSLLPRGNVLSIVFPCFQRLDTASCGLTKALRRRISVVSEFITKAIPTM